MTVDAADRASAPTQRRIASIVVGIGASAGGLEAMRLLFSQLRPNERVGYVVAQHMGHGAHAELVVRAIQRGAALPVQMARDEQLIEADAVYVIPADCEGVIEGKRLRLLPRDPTRISTPCVDVLLESLAGSLNARGWAVILSGTGRDGALGSHAIQRAGGVVIAQEPAEAGFRGMPDAVIESGAATATLPAGQIADWLAHRLQTDALDSLPEEPASVGLAPFISRVHAVTGIDFSGYREETLWRRLNARCAALGITLERYAELLLNDAGEAQRLKRLFLVSLSWFWRDRESFKALASAVDPLLARKPPGEPLRAWVAGCASGEEAYTLAALLSEAVGRHGTGRAVEILATDLNAEARALARTGEYPLKAFREAPAGWVDRWFIPIAGGYRVGPALVSRVRFELAEVEASTPGCFQDGTVDLVSCRNLLIYFMRHKQDRVVARFRQALRADGLLFLGLSENLGPVAGAYFQTLDAGHRVFLRRA